MLLIISRFKQPKRSHRLEASGELTKVVQECVVREGGGEFEQAQLTVVNECMELVLVRGMLPLDVLNASATSSAIDSSQRSQSTA